MTVRRGTEPNTIVIYAECDSLQRLVTTYEQRIQDYKTRLLNSQSSTASSEQSNSNSLMVALIAAIILWLLLAAALALWTKK